MAVTRVKTRDIGDSEIVDADVSGSAAIVGSKIVAATTTARGTVELATDGESAANLVVQGNDSRLIPSGLIAMWHGLIANIPSGWVLCDGANGTPDLRSTFVKGAGSGCEPGSAGGSASHSHNVSLTAAACTTDKCCAVGEGFEYSKATHTHSVSGWSDACTVLPPYYEVLFIMKT